MEGRERGRREEGRKEDRKKKAKVKRDSPCCRRADILEPFI